MKKYGLVLADNGSAWYFQGTADTRWPNALLDQLKRVPASAFEAVDTFLAGDLTQQHAGGRAAIRHACLSR